MLIQEAFASLRRSLMDAGVTDTPDLDARLLLSKATGKSQQELIIHRNDSLPSQVATRLASLLERRLSHEPMAYILGYREFFDLNFMVDDRVLIPRSDTETLVEAVLKTYGTGTPPSILDLCTGSGCIGITLARHLSSPVTLADLSLDALVVAETNAKALLSTPYHMVQSDLFGSIKGLFSLIVSNPPYLTDEWISSADEQVRKEPMMALQGQGDDGLSLIRRLASEAPRHLEKNGRLFLECDPRQANEVRRLLLANGFATVYIEKDLAGRERVVWGELYNV